MQKERKERREAKIGRWTEVARDSTRGLARFDRQNPVIGRDGALVGGVGGENEAQPRVDSRATSCLRPHMVKSLDSTTKTTTIPLSQLVRSVKTLCLPLCNAFRRRDGSAPRGAWALSWLAARSSVIHHRQSPFPAPHILSSSRLSPPRRWAIPTALIPPPSLLIHGPQNQCSTRRAHRS